MSDVSTYAVESKIRTLEYRLESLEQTRKEELERQRRRTERMMNLILYGVWMVAAVLLSVTLTLEATGN